MYLRTRKRANKKGVEYLEYSVVDEIILSRSPEKRVTKQVACLGKEGEPETDRRLKIFESLESGYDKAVIDERQKYRVEIAQLKLKLDDDVKNLIYK